MTQAQIEACFEKFNHLKIMVVGDIMLDSYVWGKVDRISPEAPVPVVQVRRLENRLGGAANVALNLKSMGAEAVLLSMCGTDRSGDVLLDVLEKEGLRADGIVRLNRPSTVKTRILGNHHHLLRVDEEDDRPLLEQERKHILTRFQEMIANEAFDALIFEDYDKGMLDAEVIETIVEACQQRGIPVSVDPKKRQFSAYRKVDLFKPNLKEIREGLKTEIANPDATSLEAADQRLREMLGHKMTLITLSERGVYASDGNHQVHIPAHLRNITDVSGAGDTVISVATLALACGLPMDVIADWSNLAGGLACEYVGVVPMEKSKLKAEILRIHTANKTEA